MGTLYIDTGGAATNSGSSDNNAADLSGTGDATVAASVVTLTAGTDLSGVVTTAGATQSSIYLAQATNTNQKIFWITATAGSGGATPTVTVSVAPTGVTGSNWAIGGRFVLTPASWEAAVRAGDEVVINNSPATATADLLTTRVAGNNTDGFIKVRGKSGSRPVLTVSNTTQVIEQGAFVSWMFSNLELVQQGASGNVITQNSNASNCHYYNLKISDGGGIGIQAEAGNTRFMASEITNVTGIAYFCGNSAAIILHGNYIHDCSSESTQFSGTTTTLFATNNILDTNAGRGFYISGTPSAPIVVCLYGNTVYGCGNSGYESNDADISATMLNNIFSENGNAAGEYNVEYATGTAERLGFHAWNVFHHSGGGGGANLLNLTVNSQVASSEFTTDPSFTNAAGGDFSIGSSSPAKATGYPGVFLGGSTGYLDIGAVQRQEAGGGGLAANPLRGFL